MNKSVEQVCEIYSEAFTSGDHFLGIQKLSSVIVEEADNCTALQLRSHLYYLVGENIKAINDLNDAIELSPKSANLYYDKGQLYHHCKEYKSALQAFNEATRLAQIDGDEDLIDAIEHHIIEILEKM